MGEALAMLERVRARFSIEGSFETDLEADETADAFVTAIAPFAAEDFACVMAGGALTTTYAGLEGLREGWRDFLGAFETHRHPPGGGARERRRGVRRRVRAPDRAAEGGARARSSRRPGPCGACGATGCARSSSTSTALRRCAPRGSRLRPAPRAPRRSRPSASSGPRARRSGGRRGASRRCRARGGWHRARVPSPWPRRAAPCRSPSSAARGGPPGPRPRPGGRSEPRSRSW